MCILYLSHQCIRWDVKREGRRDGQPSQYSVRLWHVGVRNEVTRSCGFNGLEGHKS